MLRTRLLLLLLRVSLLLSTQGIVGSPCDSGADVFSSVSENSPMGQFLADTGLTAEPGSSGLRLCLEGQNVHWMFLDGTKLRLNSSQTRVLDREVQGPVLTAQLICQDHLVERRFRIHLQILNENDNKPQFSRDSNAANVSELAAVNSVVFSVTASDADGDELRYDIDTETPDSRFFRIDEPNSGNVVLDKPLDFETRTSLKLLIWATEIDTVEKFSVSVAVTISVQDGDDQYPHFVPCVPLSPDVCANPSYSANVSLGQENIVLEFSPGPIKAEDGDRGLDTALTYSLLSGSDGGRFVMNSSTGHITLTRAVDEQRHNPLFRLRIMASQLDDPLKYSLASVLVRVLAQNRFPPVFNQSTYRGFVVQSPSPAAIISTYENRALLVRVSDQDFPDGLNPNVRYSVHSPNVRPGLFHITPSGVVIATADRIWTSDRYIVQVVARDEESGEEVSASVEIQVLQPEPDNPGGSSGQNQFVRHIESHLLKLVCAAVLLLLLTTGLFLLLRLVRRKPGLNQVTRPDLTESRSSLQHGSYTRKLSVLPPETS